MLFMYRKNKIANFFKNILRDNENEINIVFEGLDCSGKSTRAKLLYDYLHKVLPKNEFNVNIYNHPSTEYCPIQRYMLLNEDNTPEKEVEIFTECKNILMRMMRKNSLYKKININIIDRWIFSTIAYQNASKKDIANYTESDITKFILDDNKENEFGLDLIVYNRIDYNTFKNRVSNKNKDAKENWLTEESNFNAVKSIYEDLFILSDDFSSNVVILEKEYKSSKEFLNDLLDSAMERKELNND